ncbi:paraquat-inducible protein A [Meridianimarinicoccus aquatilis]|uniref:Paraquat-inducible membrane protein A n=1 Tax=Meridianimarinicoccus aquatilis TaxID=2552766 RepID=A0A4R6B0A6_9RHOB|nr:paraquat-inducible protein A [Fluviibacterium aquatile]QIE43626.1 paraquat-inducible membrane protein A [Rhodobacteraceae bacterium SC52]TDL88166.1 paraquat-inducible membrane protein A [Fluviibacterium aquatile]
MSHTVIEQGQTARSAGLVGCLHCGRLAPPGQNRCTRCGSHLESRYANSRQRVWAWWLAGLIVYIPANLYPMMITDTFIMTYSSTIVGGAIDLIGHGDALVGIVVLVASVMIPVGKFIAIAWVMIATRRARRGRAHSLHRMYELVEFIGRWSMIDVFVVAILAALVHLGSVAGIYPGLAAICFGASVIFTMLSALSLDPRMIWDATDPNPQDADV